MIHKFNTGNLQNGLLKLRTYHQGDNIILLHTNMDTGHSGASGRFEPLKRDCNGICILIYVGRYRVK